MLDTFLIYISYCLLFLSLIVISYFISVRIKTEYKCITLKDVSDIGVLEIARGIVKSSMAPSIPLESTWDMITCTFVKPYAGE